mmetsp:Transcript_49517/g.80299  ORF Transcript_49517/g.80299 Transcript_49517/m.80299 type:complete len:409 (+) Transcript_49517:98-1324(+)
MDRLCRPSARPASRGRRGIASKGALCLGFLALVTDLPVASAWDKDGHEAIGMTTMSALETGAVAEVKHLLGGRDAADVAAWAHKVNKKFPWTTELHFQRQPTTRCERAELTNNCPDNRCLVQAIKHFYGKLTGKEHMVDITWPAEMKLTDADELKYLINLLGDMHQPLHFGTADTDMGRNITVQFRGKTESLYDFWDKTIAQTVIHDSPGFWWGGWTHVQRTRVEYEKDSEAFKKEHEVMLGRWADETAKFLCTSVYRNPLTGKQITDEMVGGVFKISDELYETWKREMLSKMLVAGARTAIVLNSILHHREGKQLKAGSSITHLEGEEEVDEIEEERARGPPAKGRKADIPRVGKNHTQGIGALGANLAIGLVCIFCFLVLMRIWAGPSVNLNRAQAEKRQSGGKKI